MPKGLYAKIFTECNNIGAKVFNSARYLVTRPVFSMIQPKSCIPKLFFNPNIATIHSESISPNLIKLNVVAVKTWDFRGR